MSHNLDNNNESTCFEENYHIRILSINSTWKLNGSQLFRIPILNNIFCNSNFLKESKTIVTPIEETFIPGEKYVKKDHYIILNDIFEQDTLLPPITSKYLKNIDWIFGSKDIDWNIEQKKTYQVLNPSYIINQKKYYKCINCNIQSDDPNLEGECRFHPSKISLKTKEATERILCGECGFEFTKQREIRSAMSSRFPSRPP